MLSRAALRLARPNPLASTVRIPATQHSRWYAKKASNKSPPHVKASKSNQRGKTPQNSDQQKPYSAEQAEFETKADPQENTANPTSEAVSCLPLVF